MPTATSSKIRRGVVPAVQMNDEMEPEIQAILSHLASTKKKGQAQEASSDPSTEQNLKDSRSPSSVPGEHGLCNLGHLQPLLRGQDWIEPSSTAATHTDSGLAVMLAYRAGSSFPRFDFLSDKAPLTPARRIRSAIRSTPSKSKSQTPAKGETKTIDSTNPIKSRIKSAGVNGDMVARTPGKVNAKRSQGLKVIDLTEDVKPKATARPKPKARAVGKKTSFAVDNIPEEEEDGVFSVSEPLQSKPDQDRVVELKEDEMVETLNLKSLELCDNKDSAPSPSRKSQPIAKQVSTDTPIAGNCNTLGHMKVSISEETVSAQSQVRVEEDEHEEDQEQDIFQSGNAEVAHGDQDEDDVDGLLELSSSPPPAQADAFPICISPNNIITNFATDSTSIYASPETSPTRPRSPRQTEAASPIPIFIASDPESVPESEIESGSEQSFVIAPTPRKTPARRRLVVSDSDSEPEADQTVQSDTDEESELKHHSRGLTEQEPQSESFILSDANSLTKPINRKAGAGFHQPPRSVMKYIADQASTRDSDDGSGAEGAEEYDDDSLGSLRDFIVDDDEDISEYSECSDDDVDSDSGSDGIEILDSLPPKARGTIHKGKGKEDVKKGGTQVDKEERGVLYYPVPRRNKTLDLELPDLNALTIISSSDEGEEEEEEDDDEVRPIKPPTTGRKPKPTSKTPTPAIAKPNDTGKKEREHRSRKTTKGSTKADFSAKAWAEERTRIADSIFKDLDQRVFEGKVGRSSGTGAGARIEWNKRLLTTAGVARSKRITKNGQSKREFWIELSEKVLTGEKQIINTVAHEMCHLATWIISNDYKNAHGSVFKFWGRKVMRARNDVEVTTKHSYEIEYKYEWKCGTEWCGKIYKRHSKSIDTTKHACGACKGKLTPLFDTKQKTASAFQLYLKENMTFAKTAMPKASHGDVMRALSKRWTDVGAGGGDAGAALDHLIYWKSLASAAASK
ncbi:hypothetical protein IAT40_002382 [Kwoniella sp. CBS 6097]